MIRTYFARVEQVIFLMNTRLFNIIQGVPGKTQPITFNLFLWYFLIGNFLLCKFVPARPDYVSIVKKFKILQRFNKSIGFALAAKEIPEFE